MIKFSKALEIVSGEGPYIKSKLTIFSTPNTANYRIIELNSILYISGTENSSNSFSKLISVYNLKHFPGLVLPALPALYLAFDFDIGETNRLSNFVHGL